MRTLAVRLAQHQQSALRIAQWLSSTGGKGSDLSGAAGRTWSRPVEARFQRRDGLFAVVLKPGLDAGLSAMLDNMRLFKMGMS